MSTPVFCAAADDDTGATDLAGMLAGHGLRTVLAIDLPAPEKLAEWAAGRDAVIVGTGSRALAPGEAYERTRSAVRALDALGPRVVEVKYCSTFDSTAEGNIGQSLDAAMDELGEPFTVALPALPVNGRTTYMGHHFVHRQLLSESPMRDHPLTPMRNPDLVSHLQSQTARRVGLAAYPATRAKLDALRAEGVHIAVLDCIDDADLERVCASIAHLRLISGSSAPAMKLPALWERAGWWRPTPAALRRPEGTGSGFLVAAGSCSVATRGQNEWLERQGAATLALDPVALLESRPVELAAAYGALRRGEACLLRTATSAEAAAGVRDWSASHHLSTAETGLKIAYAMALAVLELVEAAPPAGLIVAGGETSGAVCRTLGLGALDIGANIDPGVPLCCSLGRFRLPVALKSGNFGAESFYGKAIQAMKDLA